MLAELSHKRELSSDYTDTSATELAIMTNAYQGLRVKPLKFGCLSVVGISSVAIFFKIWGLRLEGFGLVEL